MPKLERVRDFVITPPAAGYFTEKLDDGWRLVAIEWERGQSSPAPATEDIPFGMRVASDCRRLEEDPEEVQVLLLMLEVLVQDGPLSTAAKQINERGLRTRDGQPWTRTALFYLLPRADRSGSRVFRPAPSGWSAASTYLTLVRDNFKIMFARICASFAGRF